MTGAFLTGQPLQVRVADYTRLQRTLCNELNGGSGGWDYEGIKWQGIESYGSGGGYTNLVPLVLIRREGDSIELKLDQLLQSRPAVERMWFQEATDGWRWNLRMLRIELYDLGVGVITGVYDVAAPALLSVADTRRTAESVGRLRLPASGGIRSPVAASYDALTRETSRLFADAVSGCVPSEARQKPWLSSMLAALPPGQAEAAARDGEGASTDSSTDEWGRLLWLHPVFVLTGSSRASTRSLQRLGRPFEATFSRSIQYWSGIFTPGIDSSVVVLRGGGQQQKGPPMKLIGLMWAYYALFMEMDRGLLAMLDSDKWQTPYSLADLEKEADRMFTFFMRVQEARARLDSALTDLAGGQLSIWNTMANVQKFDELVTAVEGKVEVLQRITERRVQEAAAARARRTGNILSGLTALTVVTVVVALIGNFIGTRADAIGHVEIRVVTIAAAFLVATILYLIAQWEILRKKRGRRYARSKGS